MPEQPGRLLQQLHQQASGGHGVHGASRGRVVSVELHAPLPGGVLQTRAPAAVPAVPPMVQLLGGSHLAVAVFVHGWGVWRQREQHHPVTIQDPISLRAALDVSGLRPAALPLPAADELPVRHGLTKPRVPASVPRGSGSSTSPQELLVAP